jgi:hypothetical protein
MQPSIGHSAKRHGCSTTISNQRTEIMQKCGLLLTTGAQARSFTNLDFEQASFDQSAGYAFLDWNQGAPGWEHSAGQEADIVYWRQAHLSTSPLYVLADTAWFGSMDWIQGQYGLYFNSGYEIPTDITSPWVNAFIAQTGTLAQGIRSIQILSSGTNFQLTLDGTVIAMHDVGGHRFEGDVSAFAGREVQLRITNTNTVDTYQGGVGVDSIHFSTTAAVPEPDSMVLVAMGLLVLGAGWRARGKTRTH